MQLYIDKCILWGERTACGCMQLYIDKCIPWGERTACGCMQLYIDKCIPWGERTACGCMQLYIDKCILWGERTACVTVFFSTSPHGHHMLSSEDLFPSLECGCCYVWSLSWLKESPQNHAGHKNILMQPSYSCWCGGHNRAKLDTKISVNLSCTQLSVFTACTVVLGKTNMHTYTQINKHQTNSEETSLQKGTINLPVL